jgi:hypothetical protein
MQDCFEQALVLLPASPMYRKNLEMVKTTLSSM